MSDRTPTPLQGGTVKARGAGQPPRKYTTWEWIKGYTALVMLFPIWCSLWFLANVVRKLPDSMTRKLLQWHIAQTTARKYDVRVPGDMSIPAYMLRWWKIMRNAYFNIYLHNVLRSDDDTALHDHPWWNFSIVLQGGYYEHTILAGGIHRKVWFGPGQMQFRWHGAGAHRLQLDTAKGQTGYDSDGISHTDDGMVLETYEPRVEHQELPATTIFITGPVLRRWGFHHTDGWVDAYDWDQYCRERGISTMKMSGYAEQVAKTN